MTELSKLIRDNLSDDLLAPKWRKYKTQNLSSLKDPKTFGHCYVASETAFFILGGRKSGWKSYFIKINETPHWYLKHFSGKILDITNSQFENPVDYSKGIGKGFLTKNISKRSNILLGKILGATLFKKLRQA